MKYIEDTEEIIVFCCGKAVIVYQKRNGEARILTLPTSNTVPVSEVRAVCIKLSPDKKYLAVACESKVVTIWCTQTWTLQYTHKLVKRPMSIDVMPDSTILLVADKTGDVYHFPLKGDASSIEKCDSGGSNDGETKNTDENKAEEPQTLLGHLSMLLDLAMTSDRRYVITCDRDEKIRISHYPNSYNIESFCLGHREFVTQIELLPGEEPLLLSCSGDGTIKLWNYLKGQCLSTADLHEHSTSLLHQFEEYCQERVTDSEDAKRFLPDYPAIKNFAVCNTQEDDCFVAVVMDRVPAIFLYKIDNKKLQYISTTKVPNSTPLVVTWLISGELLVEHNSPDKPLGVFQLQQNSLTLLEDHPLIAFGKKHKDYFVEGKKELSVDILYKQRYDNVADYLKKKQERLETEKAVEAGLKKPVKKGRWL